MMGTDVFNATVAQDSMQAAATGTGGYLRAYAHSCAGSTDAACLALLLINVNQEQDYSVQLPVQQQDGAGEWKVWALGQASGAGLDSPRVALNGNELVRSTDGKLPSADPRVLAPPPSSGRLLVPATSIVFVQIS